MGAEQGESCCTDEAPERMCFWKSQRAKAPNWVAARGHLITTGPNFPFNLSRIRGSEGPEAN